MAYNDNIVTGTVDYSKFGETHTYFTKNVLPGSIQAHRCKISMANSYVHNQDYTMILITSGTGTVTVNGIDYRLTPDTLVNLGCFHVYRFTPDEGQVIKFTEARINTGAYLYLIANPYFKINTFTVPSEPPVLNLKGIMKDVAYEAMEGLLNECEGNNPDKYNLSFCYITDLFGLVSDIHSK